MFTNSMMTYYVFGSSQCLLFSLSRTKVLITLMETDSLLLCKRFKYCEQKKEIRGEQNGYIYSKYYGFSFFLSNVFIDFFTFSEFRCVTTLLVEQWQ